MATKKQTPTPTPAKKETTAPTPTSGTTVAAPNVQPLDGQLEGLEVNPDTGLLERIEPSDREKVAGADPQK